jgi:hypothetical protein
VVLARVGDVPDVVGSGRDSGVGGGMADAIELLGLVHTEEVAGSIPVSPTPETPCYVRGFTRFSGRRATVRATKPERGDLCGDLHRVSPGGAERHPHRRGPGRRGNGESRRELRAAHDLRETTARVMTDEHVGIPVEGLRRYTRPPQVVPRAPGEVMRPPVGPVMIEPRNSARGNAVARVIGRSHAPQRTSISMGDRRTLAELHAWHLRTP